MSSVSLFSSQNEKEDDDGVPTSSKVRHETAQAVGGVDPGVSGLDPTAPAQAKVLTLTSMSTSTNTYAAALILVNDADLSMHGGEDAVMTRIRGSLWFYGQAYSDTGHPARGRGWSSRCPKSIRQETSIPRRTAMARAWAGTRSWERDILVTPATILCNGSGTGAETTSLYSARVDVDVKAKRRLDSAKVPVLWYQTVKSGASVPTQVTYAGGLRMLLRRPR